MEWMPAEPMMFLSTGVEVAIVGGMLMSAVMARKSASKARRAAEAQSKRAIAATNKQTAAIAKATEAAKIESPEVAVKAEEIMKDVLPRKRKGHRSTILGGQIGGEEDVARGTLLGS